MITASGGVKCWGDNGKGQLGDGTNTDSSTPVSVVGLGGPAVAIGAGREHTCAALAGGGIKCWGENGDGQLGNGLSGDSATPVTTLIALDFVALDGGARHTCALTDGGVVYCWGDNSKGQLGDGLGVDTYLPLNPALLDGPATMIAAGDEFNCAIVTNGPVQCWGENANRQLGDGTNDDAVVPVDVVGLGRAITLTAGQAHACATEFSAEPAEDNGEPFVHCWGKNNHGQLGWGAKSADESLVHALTKAYLTNLTGGEAFTCGLGIGGAYLCWGQNDKGQLGTGLASAEENAPLQIAGLADAPVEIAAGQKHTCTLHADGSVYCWGHNDKGQLGSGTTADADVPAPVSGLP